jgi:hypothetical protein
MLCYMASFRRKVNRKFVLERSAVVIVTCMNVGSAFLLRKQGLRPCVPYKWIIWTLASCALYPCSLNVNLRAVMTIVCFMILLNHLLPDQYIDMPFKGPKSQLHLHRLDLTGATAMQLSFASTLNVESDAWPRISEESNEQAGGRYVPSGTV